MRIALPIQGMRDETGSRRVERALRGVPGVRQVTVDLADQRATVETENSTVDPQSLTAAVVQAGFTTDWNGEAATESQPPRFSLDLGSLILDAPQSATEPDHVATDIARSPPSAGQSAARQSALLQVQGMTCTGCSNLVERALRSVPGVQSARVNLATDQALVEFDSPATPAQLAAAVERQGYSAQVVSGANEADPRVISEAVAWRNRFFFALALLIPLMLFMHVLHLPPSLLPWVALALAVPVQSYVGWPYLRGAWRKARQRTIDMDALVAMGTGAAFMAGLYETATGQHPSYFMEGMMILTFISMGKWLEAYAKRRASAAIRKLLDLSPPAATVVRGGQDQRLPVEQVQVGEVIVVRPGEKVPLDAQVLTGHSSADQSWLTGESLPVELVPGSAILAGTVNLQAALTARVTRPAGQTSLAHVVDLVRRAQESKAHIQRIADRVVAWFVPAVLLLALVTLLGWGLVSQNWPLALSATVAVLVAACPCALGLATPAAVLVGSGRGAESGILIKDAQALEIAGTVDTVVLDKTGTVTLGRPQLVRVVPTAGVEENFLLQAAAAAERFSQHPLARAIGDEARRRELSLPEVAPVESLPGKGLRTTLQGQELLVGNPRLLEAEGVDWSGQKTLLENCRERGESPLLVALGGQLLGALVLADTIAPGVAAAIARLRQLGMQVHLLSGDHAAAAQAVAAQLGITEVKAEVLPQDKLAFIAQLQQAGRVVAMVGDGINDAPALSAANLGIAIGTGADVALESADVVLMRHDLAAVAETILLARATWRTIRLNLVWAFVYNILLLPLAAGLFLPWWGVRLTPAMAAGAMAASDVSVMANSLLLRRKRL